MRRTTAAVLVLLLAASQIAAAQSPTPPAGAQGNPAAAVNFELRGKIVEAKSDQPIPRASVTLRPKGSTVVLSGAIANAAGEWKLSGLRPGAYSLRVTFIGFTPITKEVQITPAAPQVDVGAIKLTQAAVNLAAVTVQEEKATVSVEPDRNSYKSKDVAPAAGNASEVLEAVPSVNVDQDGKVSLRGNENVVVQINGRPTPIRGAQLASYLKTLPANTLDRVEVIPNPSAKYDPEGMAGIINIVMKSNVDLGLSAGLNSQVSTSERYNASGNVGYQSGPISTFTSAGFSADARDVVGINDRDRFNAFQALLGSTNQDISGAVGNRGQNITSSIDYKVNARDVWSNALTLNHRNSSDNSFNRYAELNGSGSLTDNYARPRDATASGWMVDYNSAFKRTFDPRKHELSAEIRYNYSHDQDKTLLWREALETGAQRERELDATDNNSKNFVAQLDYMKMLRQRTKLETGYKSNIRWLDRDYDVQKDLVGSGNWVPSTQSNALEFDENVQAAYAVVSHGAGKFDLQGGLRAEHATRDFSLASTDKSYPYSYNSLFPSGVISYNYSDFTSMKASYSRRIRRPGTQELNPFPSFFDVNNLFFGNPGLAPEYTDSYDLGYTRNLSKGMFQVSPFFRHTTNIIRVDINTTDSFEGREVTSISFKNLASSNSWGTDMNGQLRISPKFTMLGGFNVFKLVTDGGSTSAVGSDAVAWMARTNITSELTKTFMVQAMYMYMAPQKIEKGEFAARQMVNLMARKKINGDKASIMLRVTDPFNTGTFRVKAGDDKVLQVTTRNMGSRIVFLGFQYNYGRPPKIRQPTQDQQQQGSSGFGGPPGA